MDVYDILKKLNIDYQEIEHEAVFTCLEAQRLKDKIIGTGCKNLFLTDHRKYYLVILEESKRLNMKDLSKQINTPHLSFATIEELKAILNLEIGSVTPFGIINDVNNQVVILIDKELINKVLLFHPNVNTKTISVVYDDLIKFIVYEQHQYIVF